MKISYFSLYFNAHMLPVAVELDSLEDVEFTFVSISGPDGSMGRASLDDQYPFVFKAYEIPNGHEEAMRHAEEDDFVIYGGLGGREEYVKIRAKKGLPFFRTAERILKRGDLWRYFPLKMYRTWDWFNRYYDSNIRILCAGAYAAHDFSISGFPIDKCLTWGYFPDVAEGNMRVGTQKQNKSIKFCSAQRLISWKRVDLQIKLIKRLVEEGRSVTLDIAGDGNLSSRLRSLVNNLDLNQVVRFHGGLSRESVQKLMCESDIFLATSDRNEGWGATVNEAMQCGSIVIGSDAMGAVPCLISDGKNGYQFKSESLESLCTTALRALDDFGSFDSLRDSAFSTVTGEWGAHSAVSRLYQYCLAWSEGCEFFYSSGPISRARP